MWSRQNVSACCYWLHSAQTNTTRIFSVQSVHNSCFVDSSTACRCLQIVSHMYAYTHTLVYTHTPHQHWIHSMNKTISVELFHRWIKNQVKFISHDDQIDHLFMNQIFVFYSINRKLINASYMSSIDFQS